MPLINEEEGNDRNTELSRLGTVVLKTDPGLELYAVSRLSARLSALIEKNEAAVDVNHILPLAAVEPLSDTSLRFSPHAEREASIVRQLLRSALPPPDSRPGPLRIAVLDSGLIRDFSAHRELRYFDYSINGQLRRDAEPADPSGHGTRVVSIFDQILPPHVELSVGRLPSDSLTALTIARALGDIIAREMPDVVNLSVSLRNDWFFCSRCKQRVLAPTFLTSILPLVMRLGGKNAVRTLTVMAAGNSGQIPNSRWLTEDLDTLLFAIAENRHHERARYSSAPDGPLGDLYSASAFGGDDPEDPDAQGVFIDGAHGTSFAAPFVSAVALLTKHFDIPMTHGIPTQIGYLTRKVIENAREGRFAQYRAKEKPANTDYSDPLSSK
ncbi:MULTISPECIES: S8/S53 family peptidase [Nitrosospira]|nr:MULTISPECIES: S8/S53 family peptidase [Nitrosospira]